jgi:hypothetical protein
VPVDTLNSFPTAAIPVSCFIPLVILTLFSSMVCVPVTHWPLLQKFSSSGKYLTRWFVYLKKLLEQAAEIFGTMVEIAAQLTICSIYSSSPHSALHLIGV